MLIELKLELKGSVAVWSIIGLSLLLEKANFLFRDTDLILFWVVVGCVFGMD